MPLAVGIDLGTTNSCAAVFRNGQVEVIETIEHDRVTPSIVYYGDDGIVVGKEAQNQSAIKPQNGIFDSKRLIGRCYDDPQVQKNKEKWPFVVSQAKDGSALIQFLCNGSFKQIKPEDVSAEILKKIKADAERFLEEEISEAVITVPAYFTNPQRRATVKAAELAGIKILKLINEPTAAALAFLTGKPHDSILLVFDLGGGTFDVSLMKFQNGTGEVLLVNGNSSLGGRDFDNNLIDYCLEKIQEKYRFCVDKLEKKNRSRALRRLRFNCEEIKKKLSSTDKAFLQIDEFHGIDVELEISRQQFESLNQDLFEETMKIVKDSLLKAQINKNDIGEILLIGGSTRVPKIRELVSDFFGKSLNKTVNADEAVAVGAALEASRARNSALIIDVTPLSLGIEVDEQDSMDVLIKRNCSIPVSVQRKYLTGHDNQTVMSIRVFESEGKTVEENTFLGEFEIEGITKGPKGTIEVFVTFQIDSSGILVVNAIERLKNLRKDLKIVFAS